MAGAEAKRANGESECQGVTDNNRTRPAAHTPGPWRVTDGLVAGSKTTVESQDGIVTDCAWSFGKDTCEANARLIAAAPKMLAALELIAGLTDGRIHEIAKIAAASTVLGHAD